jgi:hypothetical protein
VGVRVGGLGGWKGHASVHAAAHASGQGAAHQVWRSFFGIKQRSGGSPKRMPSDLGGSMKLRPW